MSTKKNLFSWFTKPQPQPVDNKSFHLSPSIELEHNLSEQIYNALQGEIIEEVLAKIKISSNDVYWRSAMEGHSLKVDAELLPDIYALCHEVKQKLQFEEKVDFYITGDSSVNAFSVAAEDENEPHIVNINSALFDLMSRDELRFVIGHELGHLINKDTAMSRLISFVFPAESNMPIGLQHKVRLRNQLAELVADRYGYIAVENLDACVVAFFKMASGLDLVKMNVSIESLLKDNSRRLEYFLNDRGMSNATHPVNPIRVQALNLYAKAQDEESLQKGMDELISILLKVGDSELDEHVARFMASAGILVANIDGEIKEDEVNCILEKLSQMKIYPRRFLDQLVEQDVVEVFNDSVENILKINPGMREGILGYMISIILADNNISRDEVEFLYKFGSNIGYSEMEVASAVATNIQRSFIPDITSIC
jgi:Zn-dependent protease with chaperone function